MRSANVRSVHGKGVDVLHVDVFAPPSFGKALRSNALGEKKLSALSKEFETAVPEGWP